MTTLVAAALAVAAATSVQASQERSEAASGQPANAAVTTFVSNHGQMDADGFLTHRGTVFQGFTTGSNPAGYSLSEIRLVLKPPLPPPTPGAEDVHNDPPDPQTGTGHEHVDTQTHVDPEPPELQPSVEIWSEKGKRIKMPDKMLHQMITPPSVPLDQEVAFAAPPDTVLAPNTAYYVRIVDAIQVAHDRDRAVDSGAADGWSLAEGLMHQSEGANAWGRYVPNAAVSIRGVALHEPSL